MLCPLPWWVEGGEVNLPLETVVFVLEVTKAQARGREWHKIVVAVFSVVMECCAAKRRWSREKALTLLSWLLDALMRERELVTQPRSW